MTEISALKNATPETIDALLAQAQAAGRKVFIDFHAPWCGPCKRMAPVLEQLAQETPGVEFLAVNVDDCTDFALKYSVRSVPTFMVLEAGTVLRTERGAQSKSVLEKMLG